MRFWKYQALGNDYAVLSPGDFAGELTAEQIRLICDRHFGLGSDGILWGFAAGKDGAYGLRIFNPDGSEAEKSGNGLRIFARYLWDMSGGKTKEFTIHTAGGTVRAGIHDEGRMVTVEMGKVSFQSKDIPVAGPEREVIGEEIRVGDEVYRYSAATIGNPHCVVLRSEVSAEEAKRVGPAIETDKRFLNRTNVQFMKVVDRNRIQIEIWERGAGYTLASGSSSCAAAAVAHRMGSCDAEITVCMPGGKLDIRISREYHITMRGPVVKVAEGRISEELLHRGS